jgi:hypothetical protein
VLALGVGVRLAHFAHRSPLWGDEAMLALNVGARSFGDLLHPLDYAQLAPVPFLWAVRLATSLFGMSESVLRLVPLIAGLAVLPLGYAVARQVLGRSASVLATGLIATSLTLTRYSVELKPYSLDAAVALGMVAIALQLLPRLDEGRAWRRLALLGAMAVALSVPAAFVCGAVASAAAFERTVRLRRSDLARRAGLVAIWVAAALIPYLLVYRAVGGSDYMREYWAAGFLTPGSPNLAARVASAWHEILLQQLALEGAVATVSVALLLIAGCVRVSRRSGLSACVLLLTPALWAVAASVLGQFPVSMRTMLFASPLLLVLLAAGLDGLSESVSRLTPRLRSSSLQAAALVPGAALSIALAIRPPAGEDAATIVASWKRNAAPGEPVYVFHRLIPAWTYYTTNWSGPDSTRLAWTARMAGPSGPAFVNAASRGPRSSVEADNLVYQVGDHPELLGLACGVQGRHWRGFEPVTPDSGWADIEVRRMRSAARPTIWIMLADHRHRTAREGDVLMAAVARAGATVVEADTLAYSAAYRVRFPEEDGGGSAGARGR